MLTAVAAAAIAGAAWLAIKQTLRVGVVVVIGDYSIIELRIRMAKTLLFWEFHDHYTITCKL